MSEQTANRFADLPARDRESFAKIMRMPHEARALEMMRLPMTASDVIIATFPKAGTTWTQQICHGLRSNGDMSFKEVSWVVPWIERGHMFDIDTTIAQQCTPRVFKTHLEYAHVNKGARYLHIIRDPKDVLVSFYNFISAGLIDAQCVALDTVAEVWLLADQLAEGRDVDAGFSPHLYNYWRHLLDWWAARDQAPVLSLAYEHMRQDLAGHVARIANFMGVRADAATLERATQQASFEFMAAHKEQFSDQIPGTPITLQKVVQGRVGAHRGLIGEALEARIDAAWRHYITPVLGFESYDALLASMA